MFTMSKKECFSSVNYVPERDIRNEIAPNFTTSRAAAAGNPCVHTARRSFQRGLSDGSGRRCKGYRRFRSGSAEIVGKSMKGILVEYGPGVVSPGHIHPKSAFIYAPVLQGAIRTSVNDGPPVIYKAGQNFPEMPGDRHTLDENASKTEPAKLLAVFVVDTDTKEPLLTPLHDHK
jgi:quercetin dioxygenase-like cupin family protein